jgi:acetylornithine deacetylase/succinyl-diaminopimelate desuccinylase-like protein
VQVDPVRLAPAFQCPTDGPALGVARASLGEAFGRPSVEAGSGGSIPLLGALQAVSPAAEFVLWGAEDMASARIHSSDESVDPDEIERMIVAQAVFLRDLAAAGA